MLSLFKTKTQAAPELHSAMAPRGLMRPESAASLLATPRRQKLLEHIWQRTSLSRRQFASLYRAPLERYAALVQLLPASESHHHAYEGGMLDHGLEIVAYALKLRQSYLLPAGTTPEEQAAQAEAWTATTAYAALLHDIGKIAVDLEIEQADGTTWHPWYGPLRQPYRFRYRDDREYRLHGAATGLLYHHVLDASILDWLSGYPSPWASLLYVLAGQYEHAGVLSELVIQADRASVAQDLGGDPMRAMTAPKNALQRKLVDGLRYLLKEELKLNQPQASDGWLTRDTLWLVSKTCSDKLRAHLLAQGVEGIPSSNTAVFNVLQDHGVLLPTPEGKAVWKATITSKTGWSHSFTLLRLSPTLIWKPDERPAAFSGTVTPEMATADESSELDIENESATSPVSQQPAREEEASAEPAALPDDRQPTLRDGQSDAMEELLSVISPTQMPQPPAVEADPPSPPVSSNQLLGESGATPPHPMPDATMQPSAVHFIAWLKDGIATRKLVINDAKALIHTISDTAYLVSPGVFQRYAQEHPQVAVLAKQKNQQDWLWVQKRFESLGVHRKHTDGLNIWTCEVTGPRKSRRLHGYLLQDPAIVLRELPPNNPYLSVLVLPPM
ncbi:TraI domain-containing protein [Pectobacterium betavasculorum]|uniref:MobH family relaxase n=1 Tax=Pectobacterium betavasculorum TaxID=55207 RepID=UPI00313E28E6